MANPPTDQDPDLTQGVTLADFGDATMLRGHVDDEAVILVRLGEEIVATGATCKHYGGPLEQGLVAGETVRCPWHHACFSLRTGEAVGAPAIEPVPCWRVERDGDRIVVRERIETGPQPVEDLGGTTPANVLIIGGGAAGFACAEMLRRHDFDGRITILSADSSPPYDRPKLSKQFLAGAASDDDLPLVPDDYYRTNAIDLHLNTEVTGIDLAKRTVVDGAGGSHDFDCLVIATGAEPVTPPIPGADLDHVFTLRTVEDSTAIVARADGARRAVVLGSGFIGLEVAASLTQRDVEVHVVTQERQPLEKILGGPLSRRVQTEHEDHGTVFHTETSLARIEADTVVLEDGTELEADLVVLGVGVRPRVGVAEAAGLMVNDGIVVDECLLSSDAAVYAAGDVARWEDVHEGRSVRVEHWVLAQRHGQHIARNILGGDEPFIDVPFFWSGHHDMKIRYMGHAEGWDEMEIDGDVDGLDCAIRYRKDGRTWAMATVGRDIEALEWEVQRELEAAAG